MVLPPPLLGPGDPGPVREAPGVHPRLVVVADHAGNRIPRALRGLGMSEADCARHIAYDIGAAEVARALASAFGARAVETVYSRLVIDANRYPHDPAAMPEESDGTPVPGNAGLSAAERHRRVDELFRPYHARVAAALDALGHDAFLLSVHTMTDRPRSGPARREQVAVSWADDRESAMAALDALRREPGLTVGDNTPYAIDHGDDFTTPEQAVRRGLRHLQVEIRQDLVAESAAARDWGLRLVPAVAAALAL